MGDLYINGFDYEKNTSIMRRGEPAFSYAFEMKLQKKTDIASIGGELIGGSTIFTFCEKENLSDGKRKLIYMYQEIYKSRSITKIFKTLLCIIQTCLILIYFGHRYG